MPKSSSGQPPAGGAPRRALLGATVASAAGLALGLVNRRIGHRQGRTGGTVGSLQSGPRS
ncbi:glycerophosphodiester phosphodiesterase, partial [Streptomyces sp. EAG2]